MQSAQLRRPIAQLGEWRLTPPSRRTRAVAMFRELRHVDGVRRRPANGSVATESSGREPLRQLTVTCFRCVCDLRCDSAYSHYTRFESSVAPSEHRSTTGKAEWRFTFFGHWRCRCGGRLRWRVRGGRESAGQCGSQPRNQYRCV